jgi:hypothetical protein
MDDMWTAEDKTVLIRLALFRRRIFHSQYILLLKAYSLVYVNESACSD